MHCERLQRKVPADFRLPFNWEERRPIIHDRYWFIPQKRDLAGFSFPGFDHELLFGNTKELAIEYCSGNGAWISDKAQKHPDINWLAIEKRFDRARKIWAKQQNNELQNLIVAQAEGYQLTKEYIPDLSVSYIYINFPDPWPKRRHASMRLINKIFIQEMARILKVNATVTIVTDHTDYSNSIIKEMLKEPRFHSTINEPYYQELHPEYGSSYFEELFRSQHKNIRFHCFKKQ